MSVCFNQNITIIKNDSSIQGPITVASKNTVIDLFDDSEKNDVKIILLSGEVGFGKSYYVDQLVEHFEYKNKETYTVNLKEAQEDKFSDLFNDLAVANNNDRVLIVDNLDYAFAKDKRKGQEVFEEVILKALNYKRATIAIITISDFSTKDLITKRLRYSTVELRLEPLTEAQINKALLSDNTIVKCLEKLPFNESIAKYRIKRNILGPISREQINEAINETTQQINMEDNSFLGALIKYDVLCGMLTQQKGVVASKELMDAMTSHFEYLETNFEELIGEKPDNVEIMEKIQKLKKSSKYQEYIQDIITDIATENNGKEHLRQPTTHEEEDILFQDGYSSSLSSAQIEEILFQGGFSNPLSSAQIEEALGLAEFLEKLACDLNEGLEACRQIVKPSSNHGKKTILETIYGIYNTHMQQNQKLTKEQISEIFEEYHQKLGVVGELTYEQMIDALIQHEKTTRINVIITENDMCYKKPNCYNLLHHPYFLNKLISTAKDTNLSVTEKSQLLETLLSQKTKADFMTVWLESQLKSEIKTYYENNNIRGRYDDYENEIYPQILGELNNLAHKIYKGEKAICPDDDKEKKELYEIALQTDLIKKSNSKAINFACSLDYYYFLASYFSSCFYKNFYKKTQNLYDFRGDSPEKNLVLRYTMPLLYEKVFASKNHKEVLTMMLNANCLETAALFVIETEDDDSKFKVAEQIKAEIRTNTTEDNCHRKVKLAKLLGILGDTRITNKENIYKSKEAILPQTIEVKIEGRVIHVGKYPVTNEEYSRFISARGYEQSAYWQKAVHDDYIFIDENQNNKIILFNYYEAGEIIGNNWRNIHNEINAKTDEDLRKICQDNNLNAQKSAALIYFKNLKFSDIRKEILKTYTDGQMKRPMKWGNEGYTNPSYPVIGVSFYECCAYCDWLTEQRKKQENQDVETPGGYRLLTNDEWITMAGEKNYSFGREYNELFCSTSQSKYKEILPVGTFFENKFENKKGDIYDINGNIFEWTSTIYSHTTKETPSPLETRYVVKGGSWLQNKDKATNTYNGQAVACMRNVDIGFRICYDENLRRKKR